MSVSLYFFIEVKDAEGKWHLVKWYSDRKFDTAEPTKWDFQKKVDLEGKSLFENYEACVGLAWRDELGWSRNFNGLPTYSYPQDISPELDEMLKAHGEIVTESRKKMGLTDDDFDYRKKYEMVYLRDMYGVCKEKKDEWIENLKKRIKDKQLAEISDRLDILEKLARNVEAKPYKKKKSEDGDYEDTVDYYFEEYLSDVMDLYRETNKLYEMACMFTGNRWLDSENVRLIYYFD